MNENDISYDIRGAAFKIHNELGPGLLESVYETALAYELEQMGYSLRRQVGIPMNYKEIKFDVGFRLDILVFTFICEINTTGFFSLGAALHKTGVPKTSV